MNEQSKSIGFGVYARIAGFVTLAVLVVAMIPRIVGGYDIEHLKPDDRLLVTVATWLFGAVFMGVCVGVAALQYRAAARARADLIFEGQPKGKVGEVIFALSGVFLGWFSGLMFIGVPSMLAPGSHDSVLGNMIVAAMMGVPALMLLVWRPAYRVDPARRSLVRFSIASWIPFKRSLPYEFTMHARVWTILLGRTQQQVPVAWAVYAQLPKSKEFVTEMLPLSSSPEQVEQARREWETRLGAGPAAQPYAQNPNAQAPGAQAMQAPYGGPQPLGRVYTAG